MKKNIFRFLSVALCAVTAFAVACTPSEGDTPDEGTDTVVGLYTDTWEFSKNGKVSYDPDPYDYSVKTQTGVYTVSGNDITVSWDGGGTNKLEYSNGELKAFGKTHKKLNKEKLYSEFSGEYLTVEAVWPSNKIQKIIFSENGKFTISDGNGEYYLQAITETHGIVETTVLDVMHIGYIAMYEPLAQMYYSKIGNYYHIRLSEGSHPYSDGVQHNPWKIGHNHFTDWYQRGDPFETLSVYKALAGSNGTEQNPASTTYTSGETSLILYNDGVLKLSVSGSTKTFPGGKATFTKGGESKAVTYSFIALSLNHGKIFIDMAETPSSFNKSGDKKRFVVGDYSVNGENINISFTYDGNDYSLSN